jgi:hypothetical protein
MPFGFEPTEKDPTGSPDAGSMLTTLPAPSAVSHRLVPSDANVSGSAGTAILTGSGTVGSSTTVVAGSSVTDTVVAGSVVAGSVVAGSVVAGSVVAGATVAAGTLTAVVVNVVVAGAAGGGTQPTTCTTTSVWALTHTTNGARGTTASNATERPPLKNTPGPVAGFCPLRATCTSPLRHGSAAVILTRIVGDDAGTKAGGAKETMRSAPSFRM